MSQMPARRLLALSICLALSPAAFANTPADASVGAESIDRITVKGQRSEAKSANQNTEVVDAKRLEEEMANSLEDAIRYIPGVEINDLGLRFGDNGLNIRGLSGDRVAMSIDGVEMPEFVESISSQQYEFFRAGRGSPDIDSLKQIEIAKGADSITAGSGALGGSVSFRTKDAYDYLAAEGNDSFLGFKLGHASVNDQNNGTLTFANRTGIMETLLLYTERRSHETQGWYSHSPALTGPDRRIRDPLTAKDRNILAKVDFVLNPAHRIGLVYERNRSESQLENLSRVIGPNTAYVERWGDDESHRDRYGLHWNWMAKNGLFDHLDLRLDRQENLNIAHTRILGVSGFCKNRSAACWRLDDRSSQQKQDQLAVDLDKRWGETVQHQLIYGLAWQQRELSQLDYRSFYETSGDITRAPYLQGGRLPDIDTRHWNLYFRDRIRLLDERLGITLGARYDSYQYDAKPTRNFPDRPGVLSQTAKFNAPSWSAGLDWQLNQNQTLWMQAGRGFRAPTASNMFVNPKTSLVKNATTGEEVLYWEQASNPDLHAEKSLNLELGWRWKSANAQFGVSVFRDKYDNLITYDYAVRTPEIAYEICTGTPPRHTCKVEQGNRYITPLNTGAATIKGYEIEARVRLGKPWLLRGSWSQNQGRMQDGTPLDDIAPGRGVLGLSWYSADGRWDINGNLTHTLAKKASDVSRTTNPFSRTGEKRPLSKAWSTVDLSVNFRPSENWRFNAGVYNVFDREYIIWPRLTYVTVSPFVQHGGVTDVGLGRYTAPGRNFRISAAFSF